MGFYDNNNEPLIPEQLLVGQSLLRANHARLWAHMAAGSNSVSHIVDMVEHDFDELNIFQKIWRFIFILPYATWGCALGLVQLILYLVGFAVMYIPVVRFVYFGVYELVYFLNYFFGLICNLLMAKQYIECLKEHYIEDYFKELEDFLKNH